MTVMSLYSFSRVQRNPDNSSPPIHFLETPNAVTPQAYSLEVLDFDGNRHLNNADRYFLVNHANQQRRELGANLGQNLLHYLCDPQVLEARHESLQVSTRQIERNHLPPPNFPLNDIQQIQELIAEKSEIRQPHLFWSHSNDLDLRLLQGERIFSREENEDYTNPFTSGTTLWQRLSPRFAVKRVLLPTALFAGVFIAGEKLIHSAFMWEMYCSNFLFSMVPGRVMEGNELRRQIHHSFETNTSLTPSNADRLALNLATGNARLRILEDHLYWVLNIPFITAGCLLDKNFKSFMRSPLRNFYNNLQGRFAGSRLALAGGPFAYATAALSAYAVYETTSLWFDRFGGLHQGTWANRIASGTSTLLTESALLSRVSMEMGAFTNAQAFRVASFGEMGLARFTGNAFLRGSPCSLGLLRPLGTTILLGTAVAGLALGIGYATGLIDHRSGLGQMIASADQTITRFLD